MAGAAKERNSLSIIKAYALKHEKDYQELLAGWRRATSDQKRQLLALFKEALFSQEVD